MALENVCQKRCLGYEGMHGNCCTLTNRNWIIGPVADHEKFLVALRAAYPGVEIAWEDVFIGFEEGSRLFPERPVWQDPVNYPAFRPNFAEKELPCVFYNSSIKACGVYEIRPWLCGHFKCEYLADYIKKNALENQNWSFPGSGSPRS